MGVVARHIKGVAAGGAAYLLEECLETHWFTSLRHAREDIEAWRLD